MKKLIDALPIKEGCRDIFRISFRLYNRIYSRKIELSNDALNRIFERIHSKALKVYDRKIWDSITTEDNKFWHSKTSDKEPDFPLVPLLVNYVNAIINDRLPELAYTHEPYKAVVEIFLFFIYAYIKSYEYTYIKSMKLTEKIPSHLPPELLSYAIDPIVVHLTAYVKDTHSFNSLSINFIIEILSLNNKLNQADKLRGLYNKNALDSVWNGKLNDTVIGVIMLDGDRFKQVNDKCGHDVGDEVLEIYRDSILSAIELSGNLKTRTFPARWGGEEFCVCISESNKDEIINLSKKIKAELQSHVKWEDLKSRKYEGIDFPRTFSQGIALGKKSDSKFINALVNIADKQMYKAKENGRNCIYYESRKIDL